MRRFLLILSLTLASGIAAGAEDGPGAYRLARVEVIDGEEVPCFDMKHVYCFARPKDMIQFNRLVYNVKKVYPVAKEAERMLQEIEENIHYIKTPQGQKGYIKKMEKQLTEQYTPVLKDMTFSQGKILIKLLDRQTDRTGYDIVKELRGGFRAGLYQGIARIFGANLKDTYDKDGEDVMIEEIIEMVERGLL